MNRRRVIRLEGQLRDADGQPVSGGSVWLDRATTVSGADGRFAFDGLPAGTARLHARKDDLCCDLVVVHARAGREPVTLVLAPGITLHIHVRDGDGDGDGDGDAPIAGARVVRDDEVVATSDAQGVAVVRGVPPSFELVEVQADGFAPVFVADFFATDPGAIVERTARLQRGARVAGTLVAADGAPIPDTAVLLHGEHGVGGESLTDAAGRWCFDCVAPGSYRIGPPGAALPLDVAGVAARDDIVLRVAGGEITGTVTDDAQRAVPGARVVLVLRRLRELDEREAVTDDHGAFRFANVVAGSHTLFACEGDRASPAIELAIEAGHSPAVTLALAPGAVAGTVVDTRGQPIAGAQVRVLEPEYRGDVTDAHGRFHLGALPPGEHAVIASRPNDHEGGPEASVTATAGGRDVTIELPRLATITGRVLLDGQPLAHFGVLCTTCPQFPWIGRPLGVHAADGRFTVTGIVPGTWGLVVAAAGTDLHTIERFELAENQALDVGDIALQCGRRLTGCVRDESGSPVADARVTTGTRDHETTPLQQWFHQSFVTTTDAAGAFAFAGVAHQRVSLAAHHPTRGTSFTVDAPPDDAAVVELTLLPTGAIAGVLEGPLGDLVTVSAVHSARPSEQRISTVDPSGAFAFDRLPAGDYRLAVRSPPRDFVPTTPVSVTVTASETTRVTVRIAT